MKPRMKNHFRAHQLSVWLRLIPELHRAGMEDVVARHNLFRNHNDHDLYDGIVRPDPLSRTNSGLYFNSDGNQDYIYTNAGVSRTLMQKKKKSLIFKCELRTRTWNKNHSWYT